MALKVRGKYRYGDCQADIRSELLRYSKVSENVTHHFADAVCKCGGRLFRLALDDSEGAAVRTCVACNIGHAIGDSDAFLEGTELGECACPCGLEEFEITIGVSLNDGSENVKWLYLGCRCPNCGLTGVFGDWKYEFTEYQKLLARV